MAAAAAGGNPACRQGVIMAGPSVAIVICACVMWVAAPAAPAEEGGGQNAAPVAPAEEGGGLNAAPPGTPEAPEDPAEEGAPPVGAIDRRCSGRPPTAPADEGVPPSFGAIQCRCTSRRKLRMAATSAARRGTQCPPSCRQIVLRCCHRPPRHTAVVCVEPLVGVELSVANASASSRDCSGKTAASATPIMCSEGSNSGDLRWVTGPAHGFK